MLMRKRDAFWLDGAGGQACKSTGQGQTSLQQNYYMAIDGVDKIGLPDRADARDYAVQTTLA